MIQKIYKVLPGTGLRIKKIGFFDFDKLYKTMRSWFKEHDYDFHEKEHTEKDLPQGREIIMKWYAEREIDDYARFEIDIHFFVERLIKIDKRHKGEVKMTFFAQVNFDYKNHWQSNPLYKFLFFINNNYIIKSRILTNYEPKLKNDVDDLREVIKGFLE